MLSATAMASPNKEMKSSDFGGSDVGGFDVGGSDVGGFDVALGADLVYDAPLMPHLARVLASLGPRCVAIVASTVRNEATFAAFTDALAANQLVHRDLELPSRTVYAPMLCSVDKSTGAPVRLLCITQKDAQIAPELA